MTGICRFCFASFREGNLGNKCLKRKQHHMHPFNTHSPIQSTYRKGLIVFLTGTRHWRVYQSTYKAPFPLLWRTIFQGSVYCVKGQNVTWPSYMQIRLRPEVSNVNPKNIVFWCLINVVSTIWTHSKTYWNIKFYFEKYQQVCRRECRNRRHLFVSSMNISRA